MINPAMKRTRDTVTMAVPLRVDHAALDILLAVDLGVARAPVREGALDPRRREYLDLLRDQLDVALDLSTQDDDCARRVQLFRDPPGHADLAADQPGVAVDDRLRREDHRAAARVEVAPDVPADGDRARRASHVADDGAADGDGAGGDNEVALDPPGRDNPASRGDQVTLDVGLDVHAAAEGVEVAGDGGPALHHGLADLRIGGARAGRGSEERCEGRHGQADTRQPHVEAHAGSVCSPARPGQARRAM
jgi:hypothetical protein